MDSCLFHSIEYLFYCNEIKEIDMDSQINGYILTQPIKTIQSNDRDVSESGFFSSSMIYVDACGSPNI